MFPIPNRTRSAWILPRPVPAQGCYGLLGWSVSQEVTNSDEVGCRGMLAIPSRTARITTVSHTLSKMKNKHVLHPFACDHVPNLFVMFWLPFIFWHWHWYCKYVNEIKWANVAKSKVVAYSSWVPKQRVVLPSRQASADTIDKFQVNEDGALF